MGLYSKNRVFGIHKNLLPLHKTCFNTCTEVIIAANYVWPM